MILVKPRQQAVAEEKSVYALMNAYTNNATARRDNARKLKADSKVSFKVGDYESAMSARLQMLEWKNPQISNISTLSYYAIQSSALDDIGRIASRLDAATARRFAAQLEARDAQLFTYPQVLAGQKAMELNEVDILAKKGSWKASKKDLELSAKDQAALEKLSFTEVKNNIAAFYGEAIKDAKLPYSPTINKPTMALDPYSKNYATTSFADRFLWTHAKTQRVLTVVALRARADRLEKKAANTQLPLDPFEQGPLQSKAGVVYSIGPDAVDNNGRFMPARYKAGAKGDVLAPVF